MDYQDFQRIEALEKANVELRQELAGLKTAGPGGSVARASNNWGFRNPLLYPARTFGTRNLRDRYRGFWLPAGAFSIAAGTPDLAARGSNLRYDAWALDSGGTESIMTSFQLPNDFLYPQPTIGLRSFLGFSIAMFYANLGAGSGNWTFSETLTEVAFSGASPNTTAFTYTWSNITGGAQAQDVVVQFQRDYANTGLPGDILTPLPVSGSEGNRGSIFFLKYSRIGGDAGDTLANDMGILGAVVGFWADS